MYKALTVNKLILRARGNALVGRRIEVGEVGTLQNAEAAVEGEEVLASCSTVLRTFNRLGERSRAWETFGIWTRRMESESQLQRQQSHKAAHHVLSALGKFPTVHVVMHVPSKSKGNGKAHWVAAAKVHRVAPGNLVEQSLQSGTERGHFSDFLWRCSGLQYPLTAQRRVQELCYAASGGATAFVDEVES